MPARAVIFDMDGLLIDSEPLYERAWQRAARELGYELDQATFRSFAGKSDIDSERALVEAFGREFPLPRFQALWPELWHREVRASGIRAKGGIHEMLAALAARDVTTALATSSPAPRVDLALRAAAIGHRFSAVVTCDDVARAKPAPDLFLEAARRLRLPAASCVVLEDSDAGARAAAAAGMRVIVIPDLREPAPDTRAIASAVHRDAGEALATLWDLLALDSPARPR